MDLKGIRVVSIFLHIIFFLFYAYFFMASMFFTSQSFFKMLSTIGLSFTLPLLLTIITFILVQYQIITDLKNGSEMATDKTSVFIVLNILFLGFSSYNLMKGAGMIS